MNMHEIWRKARLVLILLSFCSISPSLKANPSLDIQDWIDDIVVDINGIKSRFTVISDATQPKQWYYVPDQPRLAEKEINGVRYPEFALVKYQGLDPENPNVEIEKGILQFSVSLAIPAEANQAMRKAIEKRRGIKNIALGPLPMKDAKAYLLETSTGTLLASAPKSGGLAPTVATQKMPFQLDLTKLGADVYDAITTKTTGGVGIVVEFTYRGLTPKLFCKASFNWKKAHKYFGENKQFAGKVSYLGFMSGNANVEKTKIVEQLTQQGLVTIDSITGGDLTVDKCQKLVVEPLLSRVSETMFKSPGIELKAAAAKVDEVEKEAEDDDEKDDEDKDKKKGGFLSRFFKKFSASVSYTHKLVDINRVQTVNETQQFTNRQLEERKTIAGGFIGIGHYPEEVRKQLVVEVGSGAWDRSLVLLPEIDPTIDIKSVDLTVKPLLEQFVEAQHFKWSKEIGWSNYRGKPARFAYFPLQGLGLDDESLNDLQLQTVSVITRKGQAIESKRNFPANEIIRDVFSDIELVEVHDEDLKWKRINSEGVLTSVAVEIKTKSDVLNRRFAPINREGTWASPPAIYWFVRKNEPVTATINFKTSDGLLIPWSRSGRDLRTSGGISIGLQDSDYLK